MTNLKIIKPTPLPNFLKVKKFENTFHGSSIFATKDIPKGHIICTTSITNMDYHDGCIQSPIGDVFLHSEKPNAMIKITQDRTEKKEDKYLIDIVSIETISSGEEITVRYVNNRRQSLTRDVIINQIRSMYNMPGTQMK